jgi:monothiol glutaredoxin
MCPGLGSRQTSKKTDFVPGQMQNIPRFRPSAFQRSAVSSSRLAALFFRDETVAKRQSRVIVIANNWRRYSKKCKTMSETKIVAYLKPSCGWSQGVRAILRKYELPYEDRNVVDDPRQRQEMIEKSGQRLSPCVEINGHMLADVSGEEVESYLLTNSLVQPTTRQAEAPTNQCCSS